MKAVETIINLADYPEHSYIETPDAAYPHLVTGRCTCGWYWSGFARAWVVRNGFARAHGARIAGMTFRVEE